MSVVSIPRRSEGASVPRREAVTPRSPRHLTSVRTEATESSIARQRRRRLIASIVIVVVAASSMAYFSMLSGQQQVELQNMKTTYQTDLSDYGTLVNSLAGQSTPGIVAQKAAQLHLVQPQWVRQVPAASLATPLPLPTFTVGVTARPRTTR